MGKVHWQGWGRCSGLGWHRPGLGSLGRKAAGSKRQEEDCKQGMTRLQSCRRTCGQEGQGEEGVHHHERDHHWDSGRAAGQGMTERSGMLILRGAEPSNPTDLNPHGTRFMHIFSLFKEIIIFWFLFSVGERCQTRAGDPSTGATLRALCDMAPVPQQAWASLGAALQRRGSMVPEIKTRA